MNPCACEMYLRHWRGRWCWPECRATSVLFIGLPTILLTGSAARIVFPVITGILLALGIYLLMLYVKFKPEKFSPIEEEALRARKKYKGLVTDIKELPEAKAREMVIQLSSLDELIKAADSLLKPVLHKAEKGRHTYCVLDALLTIRVTKG